MTTRAVALVLLAFTTPGRAAHADSPLVLAGPLTPPSHHAAHAEIVAGVTLCGIAVAFAALGGGLAAARNSVSIGPDAGDSLWRAGVGIGVVGGVAVPAGLTLIIFGAAHESALKKYTLAPSADAALAQSLLGSIDAADAAASHREKVGMGLFFTGVGLCVGGALMATLGGLAGVTLSDSNRSSGGNGGLLIGGMILSAIGDGGVLSGWVVWSHAAGTRKGLREARHSVQLGAGGLSGTF